MNTEMMWMAAGSVCGALIWSHLPGSSLVSGLLTGLSIIGLAGGSQEHRKVWVGLIGLALTGINMPHSSNMGALRTQIMGSVVERQRYSALVLTADGLVRVHTQNPPAVGTKIAARLKERVRSRTLPGSYSASKLETRLGIPSARPVAWTTIDTPQADPVPTQSKHSGIIHALASGDRGRVPESIIEQMKQTGTIHLLAISGLHIGMAATIGGLVGWMVSRPLVRWPHLARLIPVLTALSLAAHYGSLVGWPTSTKRAFCMVAVVGMSRLLQRSLQPWHTWLLALTVVLVLQPHQVSSVSLWMSFGAVAGLIAWVPTWTRISTSWTRPTRWAWQSLCASTAASIGILPASAWVFQTVSLGSPLSNLMAIPLFAGVAVPASMLATYGPEWARFFAIGLAELAIDWSLIWMKWTDLGVLHPAVGAGGAALLGASVFLYKHPWWALLLGTVAMVRTDVRTTNFELTFPDVGQGGAALVGLPDGRKWLIDGGPPSNKLLFWLRRKGVRRLDTIFLTHPDTDHLGGLIPIIESLEVDTLWAPRRPRPDESQFHNFWRRAAQRGVTLRTVKEDVDGNTNENSLVIQLRHGTHRFLLTGDIGVETERRMIPHLSTYTVVQVPHHGSLGSSSEDFVRQTKPTFAVIQAGEKNRYGHPHPKVVDRWGTKRVLRTDHHGSIEFESDGLRLQTKTTQPKKLTIE